MNYQHTLKRIISSQHLYKGLRITAAALVPAVIFYHYDALPLLTAIPLGALVVGLTDSPGPFHHRRNTLLASICINYLVVAVTILLHHNPYFIIPAIIVFGIFFSMAGIYGNRANSIGLIALLVFIFNIDSKASFGNAWLNALLFTAGGAWYFVLSMLLHTLRPFLYLQHQMGESLNELSQFMEKLSRLFKSEKNDTHLFHELLHEQIIIQENHNTLREMLLETRQMVIDSTVKGRTLMMMFLANINLFEQALTLQQDYTELHEKFADSTLFNQLKKLIEIFAEELKAISIAIQFNKPSPSMHNIDALFKNLFDEFAAERKRSLNKNNLLLFIRMRQVLYTVQDIGERIKRLHRYTLYDKKLSRQYKTRNNNEVFIQQTEISPQLFLQSFTLKSGHFRHALRITIAMLTGYIFSLLFPVGHGYWILLTIVTILKPAYSISRTRNAQRLAGTITGVIIAFTFLYFITNNTLAFFVMLAAMVISYSLLNVNYYISCTCITIYVLISIHFLNSSNFTVIMKDRAIDTLIGCSISFIISLFVLPVWQSEQILDFIKIALSANREYFNAACRRLTPKPDDEKEYNAARKNAFVALANLSDSFQKMLSEPKSRQQKMSFYHQFVASSNMLTAQIATLSSFIKNSKIIFTAKDFEPLIYNVNDNFKRAENIAAAKEDKTVVSKKNAPVSNKVLVLLQQRQSEIEAGNSEAQTETRITLRELKSITDEIEVISGIVANEIKIVQNIMQ